MHKVCGELTPNLKPRMGRNPKLATEMKRTLMVAMTPVTKLRVARIRRGDDVERAITIPKTTS